MSDPDSPAETIFFGARDMPDPKDRAAWLDHACGSNHALRERVERMLSAEQQADQFLADDPLRLDHATGGESPGSVIGHYKLLQQIGEGGCGVVYMAEQEEPIRRRVALKVIKLGMDTRQVIARFEAERQALAMMDHPNIARVLDAGATETGRPYFVMELVRGIRITDYCDKNNLGMRERLDLFVTVAHAIQHAHQKGIIHRDIKPSNVLVTLHDGVPVPKVIDFGVAKAIEQKLTDKTLFTQFEQFIGTPAYTSPEQAEMSGLDIDTRSDIYSLGVLLYELLVGQTPFDAKELLKSGLNEMRRIIREQEPNRPSTRLSTMLAEERTVTAQHRAVSSPELVHLLKGDLDWIVMKCLEKDRTRRYETASGLASDIRNYLHHEPVVARPPTAAYRFGKLIRRNKLAVAAAAVVAMALIAGTVVSLWQATRAQRSEAVANEERETANEERDSAEAVLTFFRDKVLAAGRPEGQEGGLGKDVTLRKAIDAAEAQIAEAFKDRPLVEAAIRKTIGESYRYLGERKQAVQQLERAFTLRRLELGLDHERTDGAMAALFDVYSKDEIRDKLVPLIKEVLKLQQEKLRPRHRKTLGAMSVLGLAYWKAGMHEQAVTHLEEALMLQQAELPPNDWNTLTTMNNLCLAYVSSGKLDQAMKLYEETLEGKKVKMGRDHDKTLTTMGNLSRMYSDTGRHDQAVALAEEIVDLANKKRPEHPDTLWWMRELGCMYRDAGKVDLALSCFKKTFELREAKLGEEHPDTLVSLHDFALAYSAAGKPGQALPLLEKTVTLTKKNLELGDSLTLTAMKSLADTYYDMGMNDQALPLLEERIQANKTKRGVEHRDTLIAMNDLAVAYEKANDAEKALPLYEETLRLMTVHLGPAAGPTLDTMKNFARSYRHAGKLDQAEALYREILVLQNDSLTAAFGLAHVLLERSRFDTNNPALARDRAGEALTLASDSLARAHDRHATNPKELERSLSDAAELYFRHGHYAEAEPLYRQVLESRRPRLGAEHMDVLGANASLARLFADRAWAERHSKSGAANPQSGNVERARKGEQILRECLAARLSSEEAPHWRTSDVKSRLGGALVSVAAVDPSLNVAARENKFAESETYLIESHQQLQGANSAGKKYKRDALERLTRLYEAWPKPDQLAEWRQKLAAFDNEKPETAALPVGTP